ncbi:ras-related protein Rap-1 [Parasteatoda tepidariorum]|uniref:ras-related protein Rap-1 n=1 Tax=Parasteatoda tepidariorum TaxID=114398 RepID=UPI00077F8194|nr:ras-related protein Rap-1 [Parasteatoda tepidariorum]
MPSTRTESITNVEPVMNILKVADHPKVVVMGAAGVGKTSIVCQFLYERFPLDHIPTVEEMHKTVYDISGSKLSLDLLDTSGSFQFPAMRELAIKTCDAFVLVYAINDAESFQYVCFLRDLIYELRPNETKIPIVIVGNKCDLEESRAVSKDITESVVTIDWENGFVEASAKENFNIVEIFKTVLIQAHVCYSLVPLIERRKSLPNSSTCPQVRHTLVQKRHSCTIQ